MNMSLEHEGPQQGDSTQDNAVIVACRDDQRYFKFLKEHPAFVLLCVCVCFSFFAMVTTALRDLKDVNTGGWQSKQHT